MPRSGPRPAKIEARWFDEKVADQKASERGADQKPERLWDKKNRRGDCRGVRGPDRARCTTRRSRPPAFPAARYDLTSLQRDGNSRFGLSARRTLQIAQALYERHKAITYPRTDSPLPAGRLSSHGQKHAEESGGDGIWRFSKTVLKEGLAEAHQARVQRSQGRATTLPSSRPLQVPDLAKLDEIELKVYAAIVRRFIAVFIPRRFTR
jgi:DNA topoisomerase-3